MIVGRELNPKGEADIANVILYRPARHAVCDRQRGDTLVPSVPAQGDERYAPVRNLVLINTHGHPDHIGDNDLVMATPGAHNPR